MKLLVSLVFITIVAVTVYFYSYEVVNKNKKQKHRKNKRKPIIITILVTILLLVFIIFQMYKDAAAQDTQCTQSHTTTSRPPAALETATDYFLQANYDYDRGNCLKAINEYTISILLNPIYPQTYNNRAYTYMRMRNYKDALPDLDNALKLNPNYIQALMNRGDIHNYYYSIDRQSAVVDYKKVISLTGIGGTSVCGHLFLAEHNGWNLRTVFDIPSLLINPCR